MDSRREREREGERENRWGSIFIHRLGKCSVFSLLLRNQTEARAQKGNARIPSYLGVDPLLQFADRDLEQTSRVVLGPQQLCRERHGQTGVGNVE